MSLLFVCTPESESEEVASEGVGVSTIGVSAIEESGEDGRSWLKLSKLGAIAEIPLMCRRTVDLNDASDDAIETINKDCVLILLFKTPQRGVVKQNLCHLH